MRENAKGNQKFILNMFTGIENKTHRQHQKKNKKQKKKERKKENF